MKDDREVAGSAAEAREPLSRPVSPRRDPRAARTMVSFDWEPFERDLTPARGEEPAVARPAEPPAEVVHDPVPGYVPPHRTVETLAALLRKARLPE